MVRTRYSYNPELDTWTYVASMNTSRCDLGAAVVGDKIYAVGGSDVSGVLVHLTATEEYDPVHNQWRSRAAMPNGRDCVQCIGSGGQVRTCCLRALCRV